MKIDVKRAFSATSQEPLCGERLTRAAGTLLAAGAMLAGTVAVAPGAHSEPILAASAAPDDSTRSYTDCPVLLEGQFGNCVLRLQQDLNNVNDTYRLPTTGYFGPLTRIAVLDFQGQNDRPADGNVGAETADLLLDQATSDGAVPSPRPGTPVEGANPQSPVLAERCGPEEFGELEDYVTGKVGPPQCFPYQPEIEDTAAGRRAMDPFGDGCSGGVATLFDHVPGVYDFRDACATHDYAYDLKRYGVDTFREPDADNILFADWSADCQRRFLTAIKQRCQGQALAWRGGVRLGVADPGQHITSE